MRFSLALLMFALLACGQTDDGKKDGAADAPVATAPHSMLVNTLAELPPCSPAEEGWLIYVTEEQAFKVCKLATWLDVAIKGKDGVNGVNGQNGKDGADGKDGKDGVDNRIVSSISCNGQLASTSIWVTYNVSLMASGDVFAYAATQNNTQQIGASVYYSGQQNGAATAAVTFTDDYEATPVASWWHITLDRDTLVVTADYNNVDLPGGKNTWTMTPDKCVVNTYD